MSHIEAFYSCTILIVADSSCYLICRLCYHWCAVETPTRFIVSGLYSRIKTLHLHTAASPVRPLCIRRTEKLPNCQTSLYMWVPLGWSRRGATKQKHCKFEYAKWHDIYIPNECADEWMQITLILSDCVNGPELWQAPRQQRCRDACQRSDRFDLYNI